MDVTLIGISHRSAPLDVRESASLSPETCTSWAKVLRADLDEALLLSTCGRTEAYLSGCLDAEAVIERIWPNVPRDAFYVLHGGDAIRHLYRVASGLDSAILGESHILKQLKQAWQDAHAASVSGPLLNHAFQGALAVGKDVRTHTGLGRNGMSFSFASVTLARTVLSDLHNKNALVIGAGEAARLVSRHLRARGVTDLHVTSRTLSSAAEVARYYGGRAWPIQGLENLLLHADVAVAATTAQQYLLRAPLIRQVMEARAQRPLVLLDLSVPRNIDPAAGELPNVFLFNLGDAHRLMQDVLTERAMHIPRAEALVDHALRDYRRWYVERQARLKPVQLPRELPGELPGLSGALP